jgi:hypothetical protein
MSPGAGVFVRRADGRPVNTAVIGGPYSGRASVLPTPEDDLIRRRAQHPHRTCWCGFRRGGRGNRLTDRPHRDQGRRFARLPHTSCRRTATAAPSADHLFVRDDLAEGAGRARINRRDAARDPGTGPGVVVGVAHGPGLRRRVRFRFSGLAHDEWQRTARRWTEDAHAGPGVRPEHAPAGDRGGAVRRARPPSPLPFRDAGSRRDAGTARSPQPWSAPRTGRGARRTPMAPTALAATATRRRPRATTA